MENENSFFITALLYLWGFYYIFHCVLFSYDLCKENIINIYFDRSEEDLTGFVDFEIIGDEDEATLLEEHQLRPQPRIRHQPVNNRTTQEIGNPKLINNYKIIKTNKTIKRNNIIKNKRKRFYLENIEEDSDDETSTHSLLYHNSDEDDDIKYIDIHDNK